MQQTSKKQHILGLVMLSMTAIFWGAGFVLNDDLLKSSFSSTPNLINSVRFVVSAVLLAIIFARKLKFNRKIAVYAGLGGLMLFGAFTLQLLGLKHTTPSHNGFFTAAYFVFVPFITWIMRKKRPSWVTFVGVGVALLGLAILNLDTSAAETTISSTLVGDLITLACAVLFASQIALTDYVYAKEAVDYTNMTFWQVLTAAILFVLYTVIFESGSYATITFEPSFAIWRFAVVSVGGTAFAYFSQSYALKHLSPSETSVILACESPIGAIISVIAGIEAFVWNTAVGGVLVLTSVLIMELLPKFVETRKKQSDKINAEADAPPIDEQSD